MRLVFLGPPGAGKGTQAARLALKAGIPHISTGDILRRSIQLATPTGVEAREYVDRGELVPFDLILRLVRDRLQESDTANGWVLDGFPRNLEQEGAFAELLGELGQNLDRVVYFDVEDETVVERISGRRVCKQCGDTFHVVYSPPRCQQDPVCELEHIYQRSDDTEDAVRHRLEVYRAETEPLVAHYRGTELLLPMDASGPIDDVTRDLEDGLGHPS